MLNIVLLPYFIENEMIIKMIKHGESALSLYLKVCIADVAIHKKAIMIS